MIIFQVIVGHILFLADETKTRAKIVLQAPPDFTSSQQPRNRDFHSLISISNFRIQTSLKYLKELEWVTKSLITILIFLRKMHLQDLGSSQIHPGNKAQDMKSNMPIRREEMHVSIPKKQQLPELWLKVKMCLESKQCLCVQISLTFLVLLTYSLKTTPEERRKK